MFVQRRSNLLDWDLANQNSLLKLSDPGGSRALDKQDWLFQRLAYITSIWASAIANRQLGEFKLDTLKRFWRKNIVRWVNFFVWAKRSRTFSTNCFSSFTREQRDATFLFSPAQTICMIEEFIWGQNRTILERWSSERLVRRALRSRWFF